MNGETDLQILLRSLQPELLADEYVFLTFQNAHYGAYDELSPVAAFIEKEGLSLVVPKYKADKHAFGYEAVFRAITLNVHSSLQAVGLTAAIAERLSSHGISANVVAAYFHDHVFVQARHSQQAMVVLQELSTG